MNTELDKRTPWPFAPTPALVEQKPRTESQAAPEQDVQDGPPDAPERSKRAPKVTDEVIRRIHELNAQGVPKVQIARRLELSEPTVYKHLKHAPKPADVAQSAPTAPAIEMYEEAPAESADSTPAPPELKKPLNMSNESALVIDYLKCSIKISKLLGCEDVQLSCAAITELINILEQA